MKSARRPGASKTVGCLALSLAIGLFVGIIPGEGQVQTYTEITGTVSDSSGAAIPGAPVTLKDENSGQVRRATTNASGSYSFLSIPPATYTVTVSAGGFKTAQVTHRVAQVGQPAQTDFTLTVGEAAQTVTVSA